MNEHIKPAIKRDLFTIFLLFSLSFIGCQHLKGGSRSVTAGYGNKAEGTEEGDTENPTYRVGYKQISEKAIAGADFFWTNSGDDIPDYNDYPIPHSNFTDLGKRSTDEWGMALKGGPKVGYDFAAFGILGMSFVEEIDLVQSNATGWYYANDEETKMRGVYGIGIGYFPQSGFGAEISYDNRRNITFGINYAW